MPLQFESIRICELLFIILVCLVGFVRQGQTVATDDSNDRAALINLFQTTGGPAGTWYQSSNWTLSNQSMCTWFGVRCMCNNITCRVVRIILNQNGLTGTLPSSLGQLSQLQRFDAYWNKLSGTLPSSLGNLSKLNYLDLYGNQYLSGPIPDSFAALSKNLGFLYLNINQLNGTLPAFFGNFSLLEDFYLERNRLSGTIPAQIGQCASLRYLSLNKNQFEGTIPLQLGNLTKLARLSLADNKLTGTLPSALSSLKKLVILDVSNNQLSGTLPIFVNRLSGLLQLNLAHNQFAGTIPFEFLTSQFSPSRVDVSDNGLVGMLPGFPKFDSSRNETIYSIKVDFYNTTRNTFLCPLPSFPSGSLVLRDRCQPNLDDLFIVAGYALGSCALVGVVLMLIEQFTDILSSPIAIKSVYLGKLAANGFSTFNDYSSLVSMIVYLTKPINNCRSFNAQHVWLSFMAWPAIDHIDVSASFSEWLRQFSIQFAANDFGVTEAKENLQAFIDACASIPSCSAVAEADSELVCKLTDPSKALFGGTLYNTFLMWVVIALVIRLIVEFVRLFFIIVSFRRGWVVGRGWSEGLISSSPFVILLWYPLGDNFFTYVAAHSPTHSDFLRRLVHQVLLVSAPLLVLNLLYFTLIVQSGLSTLATLSLLNGAVEVPVLLVMALYSWLNMRKMREQKQAEATAAIMASVTSFDSSVHKMPTKLSFSSPPRQLARLSLTDIFLGSIISVDDNAASTNSSQVETSQDKVPLPDTVPNSSSASSQLSDVKTIELQPSSKD